MVEQYIAGLKHGPDDVRSAAEVADLIRDTWHDAQAIAFGRVATRMYAEIAKLRKRFREIKAAVQASPLGRQVDKAETLMIEQAAIAEQIKSLVGFIDDVVKMDSK